MSLLKWKELAKSKSELGNKINYVRDAIIKHDVGQQTSQQGFSKVFKPITSKLDDVIDSNQVLRIPRKKRPLKKGEVPDYGIDIEDEVPDMNLGDLFDQPVLPEQEKQLVPKPPTYEESLQDLLEGKKEFYVDPQYFPQEPLDLPPEYDEDDEIDYGLDDEDMDNEILGDLGLQNYDSVEKVINQQEMTQQKNKKYLNKIINKAKIKRNQLKGYKTSITKQFNSGLISEAMKQQENKRIDNARKTLNEYIKHYENKIETIKGSGRKKQKGGNVIFFNKPKELIKKNLIVGEILAGNTSIDMRNMGVSILDMLLKISTINRSQYDKLYKQYFKI